VLAIITPLSRKPALSLSKALTASSAATIASRSLREYRSALSFAASGRLPTCAVLPSNPGYKSLVFTRQLWPDNIPVCRQSIPIPYGLTTPTPVTTMVLRGSITSITRGNPPEIKKIHPLIVMVGQGFFQKLYGHEQSLAQPGIPIVNAIANAIVRCYL